MLHIYSLMLIQKVNVDCIYFDVTPKMKSKTIKIINISDIFLMLIAKQTILVVKSLI